MVAELANKEGKKRADYNINQGPYQSVQEVYANFVGDMLFEKGNLTLDNLIDNLDAKSKPRFIQTLLDIIDWLKQKLKGNKEITLELVRLETKYLRALKAAQKAWEQKQQTAEQQKTSTESGGEYSLNGVQPITETECKDLEKNFGTTGNFRVAGYLLTNGKLLDFSGKHWGDTTSRTRQVDHREAEEVLNRGNNGINAMVDMIGNGNIRLMPEVGGINLAVYPNEKQRRVLSVYINYMLNTEGQIVIDYDSVGGDTVYSKTYGKTATSRQILNDIRNYFNGGRQSELMSFHTDGDFQYSLPDEDVDRYTEKQYNDYGWIVANSILIGKEFKQLYSQFANIKLLKYKYPKTPNGEYIIVTGEKYGDD